MEFTPVAVVLLGRSLMSPWLALVTPLSTCTSCMNSSMSCQVRESRSGMLTVSRMSFGPHCEPSME